MIQAIISPHSVVDVGCGTGVWLAVWRELGVTDVVGLDGDYVARERLRIPCHQFQPSNLDLPIEVGRRFDLVQSLEVAEHLKADSSERFVDDLCQLGDIVLFSAAQPGQGGEHHVNERALEYWRSLFEGNGFKTYDPIRPAVRHDRMIEPWYRYNVLVFANDAGSKKAAGLDRSIVQVDTQLPDYADLRWRLRRNSLRLLPVSAVSSLARMHYIVKNRVRNFNRSN